MPWCDHGAFCRHLQLSCLGDPRFLACRTGEVLWYVLIYVGPKCNFNNNESRVFSKQILTIFSHSVPANLVRCSGLCSAKLKRRDNIFIWLTCRGILGKEPVFNLLLLTSAG